MPSAGTSIDVIVDELGRRWRARGPEGLEAVADTIDDLQELLREQLTASRRFSPGSVVTVNLRCDNRIIPDWMRPYSSHYFNRVVTFEV